MGRITTLVLASAFIAFTASLGLEVYTARLLPSVELVRMASTPTLRSTRHPCDVARIGRRSAPRAYAQQG